MAISHLYLPWLTDPHDLQGIATPHQEGPLMHCIYVTLWLKEKSILSMFYKD